jgi:hypothetical protein
MVEAKFDFAAISHRRFWSLWSTVHMVRMPHTPYATRVKREGSGPHFRVTCALTDSPRNHIEGIQKWQEAARKPP